MGALIGGPPPGTMAVEKREKARDKSLRDMRKAARTKLFAAPNPVIPDGVPAAPSDHRSANRNAQFDHERLQLGR